MAVEFDPGFRISFTDVAFLLIVSAIAAYVFNVYGAAGYTVITPAIQFFLFCNVFRIRRMAELIWVGFYLSGLLLIFFNGISFAYSLIMGLGLGALIIASEARHPSYHGIFWQKINPDLKTWFDKNTK